MRQRDKGRKKLGDKVTTRNGYKETDSHLYKLTTVERKKDTGTQGETITEGGKEIWRQGNKEK